MTDLTDPDLPQATEIPPVVEFHANTFKLKTMSLLSLLVAAWFLWIAVTAAFEGARPAPLETAQPTIAELPTASSTRRSRPSPPSTAPPRRRPKKARRPGPRPSRPRR